jgi:dCTP diphosphatase
VNELKEIRDQLRQFAEARDWDQFHSPKNLVMALSVEVAELTEHFQWLTADESEELDAEMLKQVEEEIADTQLYLIRLADKLGVDIVEVSKRKLKINEQKYPADQVRGSSKKYSEYDSSAD